MIWESTAIMTILDVAIITASVTLMVMLVRRRQKLDHQQGPGTLLAAIGIAIFGFFYLADLFTMWVLPGLVGSSEAMADMRSLHLNYAWLGNLLGLGLLYAGAVKLTERTDSAIAASQLSEKKLQELNANLEQEVSIRTVEIRAATAEIAHWFDLSADMLCIAEIDGRFTKINAAWEVTLGYSARDLLERPYIIFVHPDDQEQTIQAVRKLHSDETVIDFRNRFRHKDGSYRWLSWTSQPIVDRGLMYAIARDVTQAVVSTELEKAKLTSLERLAAELKREVNTLLEDSGRPPAYDLSVDSGTSRPGAS